jgi:hypothetical protein
MHINIYKRYILAVAGILCLLVTSLYLFHMYDKDTVYVRVISEAEGPLLTSPMYAWIDEKRGGSGVHVYERTGDSYYELVFVDNRHESVPYTHTSSEVFLKNGELSVVLQDEPAVSESDILYNQEYYLLLKEKPASMHVSVNGERYMIRLENGDWEITE